MIFLLLYIYLQDKYLELGLLGWKIIAHVVFFSDMTNSFPQNFTTFHSYLQCMRMPISPQFFQQSVLKIFWNFAIIVKLSVVLLFISLIVSKVESLFKNLRKILKSFLGKYLFIFFVNLFSRFLYAFWLRVHFVMKMFLFLSSKI